MKKRCKECAFCIKTRDGGKRILFCTNRPEKNGELARTDENGVCENWRAKRGAGYREELEQPMDEGIRYIPLTRGKFAIVDADDYEWASKFKWHASGQEKYPYACRALYYEGKLKKMIYLHREILAAPKELLADHINGNPLDDRKENLREATKSENACNMNLNKEGCSSIYRGVGWHKGVGKWVARITIGRRRIHLGVFDDEIEAAKAYDEAAKIYHGEFARLNFPEESWED